MYIISICIRWSRCLVVKSHRFPKRLPFRRSCRILTSFLECHYRIYLFICHILRQLSLCVSHAIFVTGSLPFFYVHVLHFRFPFFPFLSRSLTHSVLVVSINFEQKHAIIYHFMKNLPFFFLFLLCDPNCMRTSSIFFTSFCVFSHFDPAFIQAQSRPTLHTKLSYH